jgi:hypothetical protein
MYKRRKHFERRPFRRAQLREDAHRSTRPFHWISQGRTRQCVHACVRVCARAPEGERERESDGGKSENERE